MSAVSAESPRGSADLSTSVSSPQAADGQPSNGAPAGQADFGPNQWLVDELYQRYLADPGSVDQAWWSFFADYHPQPESTSAQSAARTPSPAGPAPGTAPAPAASALADGQSAVTAAAPPQPPATGGTPTAPVGAPSVDATA